MDRVFISYEKHDTAAAGEMVQYLEEHGVKCWIAPRDVEGGAEYGGEITRGIRNATSVILVGSEWTKGSIHVRNEIGLAFREGLKIVPYCSGECDLGDSLDFFLATTHRITPTDDKYFDYAKICDFIKNNSRMIVPVKSANPKRRRWIWLPIASLVALIVIGVFFFRHPDQTFVDTPVTIISEIDPSIETEPLQLIVDDVILSAPETEPQTDRVKPSIAEINEEPVADSAVEDEILACDIDCEDATMVYYSPDAEGSIEQEVEQGETLNSLLSRTRVLADIEKQLHINIVTIDTDAKIIAYSYLIISDENGYIKSVLSPVSAKGLRTNLFTGAETERVQYDKNDRVAYVIE